MTAMFANIVIEFEGTGDEIQESGLLFSEAEHKLTGYCNGWDFDEDGDFGPYIQEITDPVEHKRIWLSHANAYMVTEYSGDLAFLMIDEDEFYSRFGDTGKVEPKVACGVYAEKYELNTQFDFAVGL